MTLTPEQLEERKTGIGGTDMTAIMGVDPYKSEYDLWLEKVYGAPEITITNPMKRGTFLEPIVADIYAKETGRNLEAINKVIRKENAPYLLGNIDRKVWRSPADTYGALEIKCPGIHVFGKCKREGLPDNYVIQLQHYMNVTGWKWGSFAIFSAERWELIHFDMKRDDDLIEMMEEKAHGFWMMVENKTEPEIVDLGEPINLPKVTGEVTRVDDPTWNRCIEDLVIARNLKAEVDAIEKEAKGRIQTIMGEINADVCESNGVRVYFREQAGRKSFDKKALAKAHPEIDLKQFEKQGNPFKTFRFFELKPQIEYIGG